MGDLWEINDGLICLGHFWGKTRWQYGLIPGFWRIEHRNIFDVQRAGESQRMETVDWSHGIFFHGKQAVVQRFWCPKIMTLRVDVCQQATDMGPAGMIQESRQDLVRFGEATIQRFSSERNKRNEP